MRQWGMQNKPSLTEIEDNLKKTLSYFAQFKYAPTFDELYLFHENRLTRGELIDSVEKLVKQGKLVEKRGKYTLGEYSIFIDMTIQRRKWSDKKKQHVKAYISTISLIKFIEFAGYTGSVSMNNAEVTDDIDLFIITSPGRMWITRLLCLSVAELMRIRRKRKEKQAKNKVCLNLFFDRLDITVPEHKKSLYIAHEILQIKPLINRNGTYEIFLAANSWVYELFPNASNSHIKKYKNISESIKSSFLPLQYIGNFIERIVRSFQLKKIMKHRTNELITDTQLWFFPNDYKKKLKIK